MNTDMATTSKSNLPAASKYECAGVEDITHADVPKKYININKDLGHISVAGTDIVLAKPGESFKITPVFQYSEWLYFSMDGMSVLHRELRHEKNRNVGLRDEEVVTVETGNGGKTQAIRRLGRVVLALVADREHEGPMFISCNRSKRWAMEATFMSKLLENQKNKLPLFAQEFIVSPEQKTNKKGQKFYVYNFKAGDIVKDEGKLNAYYSLYQDLKSSQDKLLHANESEASDDRASF